METQTQLSYDELLAQNKSQSQRIKSLEEDLQNVLTQLIELKRHVFGRKSEKLDVISQGQQFLFSPELPQLKDEPEIEVGSYKRSKRNGRKPLPRNLPRERIEYEPEEQNCSCCGSELEKIGEDISEELDYIPAKCFIREHARIKKACPKCKSGVSQGKLPRDAQRESKKAELEQDF